MHRRTISVAVSTAAALTAGLAVGSAQATDDSARAVRIQPGELSLGPDAAVLHSTRGTIHAGDDTIFTTFRGRLYLIGRSANGFVVVTLGNDRLWNVDRDGIETALGRLPQSWENVEVSTDGTRVAYSSRRDGNVWVTVKRVSDGVRLHRQPFANDVELEGYGARRLLMSRWLPVRTFWYAPASRERTIIARQSTMSADVQRNRIGFVVRDPDGYDGICMRMARLSTPHDTTWRSCKQKPLAWSSQRGRVLTTDIRADGLGPSSVQIRKVDGTLLRTFDTGVFGDVRFASPNTVILSAQGARVAALVRCTTDGDCERTTGLKPAADLGPNAALRLSMPD